ncbi:type II toxin-antitoxin system PemK/MazF family toxin [Paracoccus isoporae]|uniref:type II toxin-antitoxin system PemK/MazF family toxin n=1 Tax=Paracoccus isoporae TaxID=591205 RepID=UPI0015A2FFDF|nr:type II toxin-antitoxin system PemK/MazF family toxin [Paracoccus isoporae]
MAIGFHPRAGQILVGDFSDLQPPEICKVRPVIVVSPKLRFRSGLVAIVPVSLTAPRTELPYVHRLSRNYHPDSPDDLPCWAKCDLLMNISLKRLNGFKVGRRKWATPSVSPEDLAAVPKAVAAGLGLQVS